MRAVQLATFLLAAGMAAAATTTDECLITTLSNVNDDDPPPTSEQGSPVVRVSQGSLRGKRVISRSTRGVIYSFQGIPYAQPPVGDLRFKAPKEPISWTGIRNATSVGDICTQYDNGAIRGSEDCLFLNVFTPQLPRAKGSSFLPVMVWIHGGGDFGSGNPVNYGPDLLVAKNVIVVTLNYRVGVLGLLNVRSSLSSQNNGLKDQVAALKWIQANIAQFGGDKNKVTIFGQSFGSSSVEFLMLSPTTKGLFHGAISHSGNALDRWAYVVPSRAQERAFVLGKLLGLTTNDGDELVRFLKTTPVADLLATQGIAFTDEDRLRAADIGFLASKEELTAENTDIFLPDSPLNIVKSGKYNKVPYITGFAVDDAKMAYLPYLLNASLWGDIANNMEQFVPPELAIPLGSSESLALAAEIKKLYFGDDTPTVKNIRELIELGTDAFFVQGMRRSIHQRLKTSSTPIYAFQFSYVGSISLSEFCKYNYPFKGAAHTDDLCYLFWIHRIDAKLNSRDRAVRDRMTTMWTNFAKTGNPNGHRGHVDITWEPVTKTSENYLNIDAELSMRDLKQLRPKKFAFWDRAYSRIDN